ncbi:MAG: hypothetical protein A2W86_12815 [Bacteroidetes bacterium GWD2_45_23]|nr:MAG: hypothetical protein A2W87_09200 [Bacteroidetes bacterium GWC2_46_850]OFX82679.1 MAG: hypothetical protein A2W86_12815 [Bacteroidetes bacterium GWD2_45_23]HBB02040.1 DUF3109 domain-containing protein [Porphyromonadaceae bacterium]HCC17869.1 DUF3109 domain-containing protein [Porphyromonadaceae bacterium]
MIQIQNTLISDDIFEEQFICDLCKCKGQCCVEGESGAPITREEFEQINEILPQIRKDLSTKALEVIDRQGIAYTDTDGELVTSIIDGRECVFASFDADGVCKCTIDSAFREGRISVQKPISCHLYPIRLHEYADFTAVNYHRWSVCRPAQKLGRKEGLPLYRFLREPLIRKFGEAWYQEMCEAAALLKEKK